MLMESKFVLSPITKQPIRIRIGVHTGPVVAGVVGMKMPRYVITLLALFYFHQQLTLLYYYNTKTTTTLIV